MFKKDDVIYNWRTKRIVVVMSHAFGEVFEVKDIGEKTSEDIIVANSDWMYYEAYKRYRKLGGLYDVVEGTEEGREGETGKTKA